MDSPKSMANTITGTNGEMGSWIVKPEIPSLVAQCGDLSATCVVAGRIDRIARTHDEEIHR